MMSTQLLCFFAIFASSFLSTSASSNDELYVIRSKGYTNLVLDGSDSSQITIQYFTNSTAQLWKFERGSKAGLFYITNYKTGKVLDLQPTLNKLVLVARQKDNVHRQQWSLRLDGKIVHSENERNFDVSDGRFFPGTQVGVWDNNGSLAQAFLWEKVRDEEEVVPQQ